MKRIEGILLFLSLLFLPTQLGKHFWPQFSFVYSLPIDYLSPTVYFWDLLVVFLISVWVIQKGNVNRVALNLYLLFIFTQAISLLQGPENTGAGLVRLEQYTIAGLFGVYLASVKYSVLNIKLFWPVVLGVMFESFLATVQFLKGATLGFWILGERTFTISTPAIAKFDFYGREFLRPYGTFPHPNVLAAFLVVALPLLSFLRRLASRSEQASNKKFIYGSLIRSGMTMMGVFLGTTATLLTVSRVAIIAGCFSALILLNKKWKALFLVILIILSPIIYTRFSAVFNFDSLSLLRREELSSVAWNMFLKNPIFGVGLNKFIVEASDQILVGPSRFLQPVHNIFLLALAETGITGLMGLIGLIGYPILRLLKLQTTNYPLRSEASQLRTLLLLWGIIIFLGLFDHYFLTLPQGYRLLFLVWGISISMLEWKT